MRTVLLSLFLVPLAACTHHPVRIDCDQHLEAINPPHPTAKPDTVAKSP
jgi:hypothetical protein